METPRPIFAEPLRICLVSSDERTASILEAHCPTPNTFSSYTYSRISDGDGAIDALYLDAIAEGAQQSHAILAEWDEHYSPQFNLLCQRLSFRKIPLIALCPSDPVDQKIAFIVGADYAVTLPALHSLLKAHIAAFRRIRIAWHTEFCNENAKSIELVPKRRESLGIRRGPIFLDVQAHRIYIHGKEIVIRARLFKLLKILIEHEGDAVSRDELFKLLSGDDNETCSNLIDVYVKDLRGILKEGGLTRATIRTIRGVGYCFLLE